MTYNYKSVAAISPIDSQDGLRQAGVALKGLALALENLASRLSGMTPGLEDGWNATTAQIAIDRTSIPQSATAHAAHGARPITVLITV